MVVKTNEMPSAPVEPSAYVGRKRWCATYYLRGGERLNLRDVQDRYGCVPYRLIATFAGDSTCKECGDICDGRAMRFSSADGVQDLEWKNLNVPLDIPHLSPDFWELVNTATTCPVNVVLCFDRHRA